MNITSNPLYLDWSFWAVIVALLALILSQLPPIHLLLKRAKIDFELYSKINLTHKVGNPNLQIHILISNNGGRKVRIRKINAIIKREGKNLMTLPAQNYLQNPNDSNTVLFTSFSLKPGEDWGHILNLFNPFGRAEENQYRKIEADVLADYRKKRSEINGEPEVEIELDPENVKPIHDFFERHFIWLPGEYKLQIEIVTEEKQANINKAFRFTIFESHHAQLREIANQFKFGGGVWWEPKDVSSSALIDIVED